MDANFENLDLYKYGSDVQTLTTTSSLTPSTTRTQINITALASALSIEAPTGITTNAPKTLLRIKDDGTSRSITWNAIYRGVGVTLPSATTANKTLYIGYIHNPQDSTYDVIATAQEV